MAIALDTSSTSAAAASWSHTCTGANLLLLVLAQNSTGDNVTGVTYNGVAMTQLGKVLLPTPGASEMYLYGLLNPATGSHTIAISASGGSSWGDAASYTGVKQSGLPDAVVTGSNTAGGYTSQAITTIADNCWTVAAVQSSGGTPTAGTNTTSRQRDTAIGVLLGDSNGAISPAGSYTMQWTCPGSGAGIVVSIAPTVAAALAGAALFDLAGAASLRTGVPLAGAGASALALAASIKTGVHFSGALADALDLSGTRLVAGNDITVLIAGLDRTAYVNRYESEVQDNAKETPNTASVVVRGFTPTEGQRVTILQGITTIFDGEATDVEQIQRRTGTRFRYRLDCTDWNVLANRRLVAKQWLATSVSTIVAAIISGFTSGFTVVNVEASLAAIDFTATLEPVGVVLTRLADAVGATWKWLYSKDLYFRATSNLVNPTALTTANATFRALKYRRKIVSIANRVYVTGKGTSVKLGGAVLPAGTTQIPLQDASFFGSSGSCRIGQREVVTFSAKAVGATGSKAVGPLQSPGAATGTRVAGGGRITANRSYKVSFVLGDRGESELGSVVTVSSLSAVADYLANHGTTSKAAGPIPNGNANYLVTYSTGLGETAGTVLGWTFNSAGETATIGTQNFPDARVIAAKLYRTKAGVGTNGPYYYVGQTTTSGGNIVDSTLDAALGAAAPNVDANGNRTNTTGDAVNLTAIPTGPSGTTARNLWASYSGSAYLRAGSIPDNTTTIFTDALAEAALGSPAHTFCKVSTLTGSTALRMEDCAQVPASGWIEVSGQLLSYTGRSASSGEGNLTGIPASGVGAIVADINAGTIITAVPFLTTAATAYAVNDGDAVALFIQRDDAAAQAALAALEGGDGIHEFSVEDSSLETISACTTRGDAELLIRKNVEEDASYTTEDKATVANAAITITISNISTTLTIQHVRIYWIAGRKAAQRDVTASNQYKTLAQYLGELQSKIKAA